MSSVKTECGVFGISLFNNNEDTIRDTINGLKLLQHRGRESAGISYLEDNEFKVFKNSGLVKEVFKDYTDFKQVNKCIGHVRYSTSGKSKKGQIKSDEAINEIQPYITEDFAIVYNGNISNLDRAKIKFNIENMSIDTQMIIEIIKNINKPSFSEKLIEFIKNVNGVYCFIILTRSGMYCIRDSFGVRPLSICKTKDGFYISSETCAFDFEYEYLREVKPGEILCIRRNKIEEIYHHKQQETKVCIFEHIYFMNKNSLVNNKSLEKIRFDVGKIMGEYEDYYHSGNTYVVGCPETGIPYGKGFADGINLEYIQCLKKKQDSGRTFILPDNDKRIVACKKNLYVAEDIQDKNIILVDDSLVRGNTLKSVIETLRNCGAKSIHIRITSPPVKHPCYFGVDIPSYDELIASSHTIEEIRVKINADTLEYVDLDIVKEAIGKKEGFCSACFDGEYCKELIEW